MLRGSAVSTWIASCWVADRSAGRVVSLVVRRTAFAARVAGAAAFATLAAARAGAEDDLVEAFDAVHPAARAVVAVFDEGPDDSAGAMRGRYPGTDHGNPHGGARVGARGGGRASGRACARGARLSPVEGLS